MKYYVAYGSNLNVHQMALRCPRAELAGIATLRGWRLLFRGSRTGAYLTIERCKGAEVPVAVWEITEHDERSLDRYEGFPAFYYKRTLPVVMDDIFTGDRLRVEAMVYVMHEDRPLGIPSQEYLDVCAEGYRDFGFDLAVLQGALDYVRREVSA